MLFRSDHALGEVEMTATQINAAKIVLGKIIPDLARTEVAGDPNNPLEVDVYVDVFGKVLEGLKLARQAE